MRLFLKVKSQKDFVKVKQPLESECKSRRHRGSPGVGKIIGDCF